MGYFKIFRWQLKSVAKDPMAMFLSIIPFLFIILIKFGIPALLNFLLNWVDLRSYTNFILFVFYLMTPSLLGIVLGLLLMDERDLDTLSFIEVTPISIGKYISFKASIGVAASFITNIIIALTAGEDIGLRELLLFVNTSLLVPFYALIIYSFSRDKVQGLTIGKLSNFVVVGAIVPYFSNSPTTYILGLLPTFWAYHTYYSSSSLLFFIVGSLLTTVYIVVLFSRIRR